MYLHVYGHAYEDAYVYEYTCVLCVSCMCAFVPIETSSAGSRLTELHEGAGHECLDGVLGEARHTPVRLAR